MNAAEVIWTKKDNLDTIRENLLSLIGKNVMGKDRAEYTILKVGEIHETVSESTFSSMSKVKQRSMARNFKDTTGFGWPETTNTPMWGFIVEFGREWKEGRRTVWNYDFMIPRESTYEADLKKYGIMEDPNHPFIFYDLK